MEPNKLQHDSFIPNPAAPANIFVRIKTVLTYEPPIGQSPPAYLFFKQRYFRALVFLLMCLFNTIVYTGWQHFAIMLYRSGAYRWQCSESELKKLKSLEDPCEGAQTNSVQALLRVGLSSEFICGVFAGLSLDHLGPWFTALLGCVSFFLGWMGLVYSTQKFQAYIPAMVLLAGSVNFVAFPCLSLGDLFPEYAGLAVSLVVAAQTTATAVAPVMVLVWDSYPEYSYGHIIWGYLAVAFFPVASLYLLCVPWSRLTVDPLSSIEDHSAAVGDSDAHSGTKGHPEIEHPQKEQEVLATTSHVGISHATIEEMSFLSQITSVEFIMFTVYYVIQVLQFSYYPSTVQPQYGSEMSNFSGWALTSQGLFGALFGLVVDKTKTLPICVVLVLMVRIIDSCLIFVLPFSCFPSTDDWCVRHRHYS